MTDEQRAKLAALDSEEQQALDKLKKEVRRAQRELGRAPEVMGAGRVWFDAEEERNNAYAAYLKDEPKPNRADVVVPLCHCVTMHRETCPVHADEKAPT